MENLKNHKNSNEQEIKFIPGRSTSAERSWERYLEGEQYQSRIYEQGFMKTDMKEFD